MMNKVNYFIIYEFYEIYWNLDLTEKNEFQVYTFNNTLLIELRELVLHYLAKIFQL